MPKFGYLAKPGTVAGWKSVCWPLRKWQPLNLNLVPCNKDFAIRFGKL